MSLFSSQIIIAAIMVIDNTLYFTEAQYRFRAWTVGFLNKLVRSVFIWSSLHESCCFFVLRREKAKCFPHFDGRGAGGKAVPGHRGQRCRRYRPRAAASSAPGAAGASMGLPGPGETPPAPLGLAPLAAAPARRWRAAGSAALHRRLRRPRPAAARPFPRVRGRSAAEELRVPVGSSAQLQREARAELGRSCGERREAGAVRRPGLIPGEQRAGESGHTGTSAHAAPCLVCSEQVAKHQHAARERTRLKLG